MSPLERNVWATAYVRQLESAAPFPTSRARRVTTAVFVADFVVRELREEFARDGRTEDPIDAGRDTSDPTPPAGPEDAASPAPKRR